MNKILEYVISAKDKTGAAVSSALARVKSFASSVAQNLANVKAGFDMLAGFARSFSSAFAVAIKEAFKFEKATADFKVLRATISPNCASSPPRPRSPSTISAVPPSFCSRSART